MELLFKRDQGNGKLGGINFTLWGKVELTEEEQKIVDRYNFNKAIMIEMVQPSLLKTTGLLSFGVFILIFSILSAIWNADAGLILELLSNLVFRGLNQAATWSDFVTSIPSLNFTPVMTFAR